MKPCKDMPCAACPMRRRSLPGWLGAAPPEQFADTAGGDDFMPCHLTVDYNDPDWRDQLLPGMLGSATECAGVAIYRANMGKLPRPIVAGPIRFQLRRLPANKRDVFASRQEFLEHHTKLEKLRGRKNRRR